MKKTVPDGGIVIKTENIHKISGNINDNGIGLKTDIYNRLAGYYG